MNQAPAVVCLTRLLQQRSDHFCYWLIINDLNIPEFSLLLHYSLLTFHCNPSSAWPDQSTHGRKCINTRCGRQAWKWQLGQSLTRNDAYAVALSLSWVYERQGAGNITPQAPASLYRHGTRRAWERAREAGFVVVLLKGPQAEITSTAEPFRK